MEIEIFCRLRTLEDSACSKTVQSVVSEGFFFHLKNEHCVAKYTLNASIYWSG